MEKLKKSIETLKQGDFIHEYTKKYNIDIENIDVENINFEEIVIDYYKKSDSDKKLDNFKKVTKKNIGEKLNTLDYYDLFLDFKKDFNLFIKFNNYYRRSLDERIEDNEKILLNFYITQYAFLLKFGFSYRKIKRENYIKLLTILDNIEYNVDDTLKNIDYKKLIIKNYYQLYEKFSLNDENNFFRSDVKNAEYYNYLKKNQDQDYTNINDIIYPLEKKNKKL